MSRCWGTTCRYSLRCRRPARAGFLTCPLHASQEALAARLMPETVGCEQMALPAPIGGHSGPQERS